jgi:hypothetical protein
LSFFHCPNSTPSSGRARFANEKFHTEKIRQRINSPPRRRHHGRARQIFKTKPKIARGAILNESSLDLARLEKGWLDPFVNIAGKPYLKRESIEKFTRRAAAGEFAKAPHVPRKEKGCPQ